MGGASFQMKILVHQDRHSVNAALAHAYQLLICCQDTNLVGFKVQGQRNSSGGGNKGTGRGIRFGIRGRRRSSGHYVNDLYLEFSEVLRN